VAATLVVALSLVGGVVAATRQTRRAELERKKMEQVNEFLSTMLSAVDPGYSGRDVTVAQVLDRAVEDIGKQKLDPEIEGELQHTIGQTFYGLGIYKEAEDHIRRAYALRERSYGELDQRSAQTYSYLVALAEARGAFAEAESLAKVNVSQQRRMPRSQQKPSEMATALDNLARMVEHRGRLDEALSIKLQSIALRRASNDSATRVSLPYTLNNLAVAYMYRGEREKADTLMREALAVEASVHGRKGPNFGSLLRGYADLRDQMGAHAEGDSLIHESIRVLEASVGVHHTEYLRAVSLLAQMRYMANDMQGTIDAARRVVPEIGAGMHEGEPSSASVLQALGLALDSLKRHAAADTALARSLAIRRKYMPPDHWAIASSEAVYGYHLGLVGRNAEAEQMLAAAYAKLVASRGADNPVTQRVAVRLAELMEKLGRTADAKVWRARG